MKYILLILSIILLFTNKLYCQINFVRNGSLEQYWQCPTSIDQIKSAKYWGPIDTISVESYCVPEYCNACSSLASNVGVPKSYEYYHYPRSGNGMAQVRMYDFNAFSFAAMYDYLQGRFFTNLVAGKIYCISFYVTLTQISKFAINHIGAYIDDGSIDAGQDSIGCSLPQTSFIPQIVENTIINDTLNWVKIQGSYIATGNEKFITIGNFFSVANIDTIDTKSYSYPNASFYLVDDVSVIESDVVADAGADQWVTPGGDSVYIGIPDEGLPTTWYIAGNPTPLCSGAGGMKVHPDTTTRYVVMLDLCGHVTTDTVVVWNFPSGVRGVRRAEALVEVYPNPATTTLNVAGAAGCEVGVYDMVGRRVFVGFAAGDKLVIDVGGLAGGVYFVEVMERETGVKVVKRVCLK